MLLQSAARILIALGLAVAIAGWWMKGELPLPGKLQVAELEEPVQVRVRKPPFNTRVNGVDYRIQPRYSYELNAVVVSLHHSDSWWDYAHKEWGDNVNIMDLCVAWGDSVRSGAYRDVSFSNNQWECTWTYSSERAHKQFNNAQASNNHIVTDDPALSEALRKIEVGDQVRLRGYLVDYTIFRQDGSTVGSRISSETRTDVGPGACEVMYIDGFENVASPNRGWRIAQWAGMIGLFLGLVLYFVLPVRADA